MHRSGTSLVTSVLDAVGVTVGGDLLAPNDNNPQGYWEDQRVIDINNQLLNSLNLDWYSLKALTISDIKKSTIFRQLLETAVNYLQHQLNLSQLYCFKDPRTALLLPFWLLVFDELKIRPHYVICKRNPDSIISSLHKRDNFPFEYAAQLLFIYWYSIAKHTYGQSRTTIEYEDLRENELEIKRKLSRDLRIDLGSVEGTQQFKSSLNHGSPLKYEIAERHLLMWQLSCVQLYPEFRVIPELENELDRMRPFFQALEVANQLPHPVKRLTDKITRLPVTIPDRVCVYGASNTLGIIVEKIRYKVFLCVDRLAERNTFEKYGLTFESPTILKRYPECTVLVTVIGRKKQIKSLLAVLGIRKILFIEDLL